MGTGDITLSKQYPWNVVIRTRNLGEVKGGLDLGASSLVTCQVLFDVQQITVSQESEPAAI